MKRMNVWENVWDNENQFDNDLLRTLPSEEFLDDEGISAYDAAFLEDLESYN